MNPKNWKYLSLLAVGKKKLSAGSGSFVAAVIPVNWSLHRPFILILWQSTLADFDRRLFLLWSSHTPFFISSAAYLNASSP